VLSQLLRPLSVDLADAFERAPTPIPLRDGRGGDHEGPVPGLGDSSQRVVILAGPGATLDAVALHALADHLGAPVANTWGAKGIYPWNDPHHMGTCGLQRDDFMLLGFAGFDIVLAIGIDEMESPPKRFALTETVVANPGVLRTLRESSAIRPLITEPNELYTRIAAIAQPGYVDDSVPRHPARAVMDLKQSLGPTDRVTAAPGLAGLWIARTFPTDRMGSVIVPAQDRPGIGAAVGLVSAHQGTPTVCVVHDPVDDVTAEVMTIARAHELPLRLEVWGDDVDWSRTDDLIAAAGPVVAWTDPTSQAIGV
jgi:Thiamine pyrophosphate-requiring enzymes [acetolactate synthase, pyruvate dehydrogenase (cytochrome), glyoxylate carboligase, phosphonopyruvate decarboxylase]